MMPAATHLDPVIGIDLHIVQPPGPVPPIPVPHPYVGIVFDPADYVPIIGSTVKVNGMHRAIAGTAGKAVPPHIPIGGVFIKPPGNEDENFMGSATVSLDGDAAAYMALPCLSCSDIGMPAPPRLNPKKKTKLKSLLLPTSVVLPIPKGPPVFIGGPPTISLMGMAMKLGMAGLGRGLRRLARSGAAQRLVARGRGAWRSVFRRMPPGFLKCQVLRAEPVDAVSGEVVVEQLDFELPSRIPIVWTRHYRSGSDYDGWLGPGWETPADARLCIEGDGSVTFWDGSGTGAQFRSLPSAARPVKELINGGKLYRTQDHLAVRLKGGLTYFFSLARDDRLSRVLRISAIVDLHNNYWNFIYDQDGLREIVESTGRRIEVQCKDGTIRSLLLQTPDNKEPRHLCRYRYDQAGHLVSVSDAMGEDYNFQYSGFGMDSHTDRGGLTFYYAYDENARVARAWGDGGLYDYQFVYNPEAKWTEVTDSLGNVSTLEYDIRGHIIRETDPLGGVTQFAYDEVGRTSEVIDPAGNPTLYRYDEDGNLIEYTRPDGVALTTEHDLLGNPIKQTDGNGNVWSMEWDEAGKLSSRSSPSGAEWHFYHDALGDLVRVEDPRSGNTRFRYDPLGMMETITDPTEKLERFRFDTLGKLIGHSDPGDFETNYGRDAKGRLTSVETPSGATTFYDYDRNDNIVAVTDPEGHTTRFLYFGQGEVAERHQPDGTVVKYEYDTEERLVAVINEAGERYEVKRDALGRVIEEIDYWGNGKRFKYDRAGNVTATKDALDRIVWFEHDALGRLAKRRFQNGSEETFAYDGNGNLTEAINSTIDATRSYDADGNMVQETQGDFVLRHEYDATGNRTKRISPYHIVEYAYDLAGRTNEIRLDGEQMARMFYDERGSLSHEYLGPHLRRDYEYNPDGMVARQLLRKGPEALVDRRYTRDRIGSVLKRETIRSGEHHAVEYTYDPMERIVASRDSKAVSEVFEYTPTGDLLKPISQHPTGARRSDYNGLSYIFDAAGNLVHRRKPEGDASFEWDAMNRLVGAVNEEEERIEFKYDALGRRFSKDLADEDRTLFRYDGQHLLSYQKTDHREVIYSCKDFMPYGVTAFGNSYLNLDPSGLPLESLDQIGTLTCRPEGNQIDFLDSPTPLGFAGQFYDQEISLCHNSRRYFDPASSSFISIDPSRLSAGENLYEYAPNIWGWIDPLGLSCNPRPTFYVDSRRWPNVAETHRDYFRRTGRSRRMRLTRVDEATAARNRHAAQRPYLRPEEGYNLDEFPYASTAQGGSGSSIIELPEGENKSHGAALGNFYDHHNIQPGDSFWVEVI